MRLEVADAEETWMPTIELRWLTRSTTVKRPHDGAEIPASETVLQRMWQGSNGNQKWEDIPHVKENDQ